MKISPDFKMPYHPDTYKSPKAPNTEILHGPLNLVLRAGRLFGVAPITFNDTGIIVSTQLYVYSLMLIISLGILTMAAFGMDLQYRDSSKGYMTGTQLYIVISFIEITINFTTTIYGVYGAPKRMKAMTVYMEQAEKIKQDLNFKGISQRSDKKRRLLLILLMLYLFLTLSFDFILDLLYGIFLHRDLIIHYLYVSFKIQYIPILLLEMQFVFVVFSANDLLNALNYHLEEILRQINMQLILKSQRFGHLSANIAELKRMDTFIKPKAIKVDVGNIQLIGMEADTLRSCPGIFRRLTQSYNDICSLVRQIDDAHGPLVLLLVLSNMLQLIIAPCAIIVFLKRPQPAHLSFEITWCLFHILYVVVLIEPCNETNVQLQRTHVAVSNLICKLGHSDPMYPALNKFFQQLFLNIPSYTLGNVTTLGRPFLASILGSVTTYLVIIIQFQSSDTTT